MKPLPDTAKEIAHRFGDAAHHVTDKIEDIAADAADDTRNMAQRATETAKEIYHSAAVKAEETLTTSKEYVRRNPVPVVLGALAFGVALGYVLVMARRKPTFSERYADEPLGAMREAFLGAIAPVTQRVHKGYDSARDEAGKAMERVHHFSSGRNGNAFSHQIGRIGSNLKFW